MKSDAERDLDELRAQYRGQLRARQWLGFHVARLGFWLLRLARWLVAGSSACVLVACGGVSVYSEAGDDVGIDELLDLAPNDADAGDDVAAPIDTVEDLGDDSAEVPDAPIDAAEDLEQLEDLAADVSDDSAPCGAWFYGDVDGDGFGAGAPLWLDCGTPPPAGYVETSGDCCDGDRRVHPGAEWQGEPHTCDDVAAWDFDCDGVETRRYGCPVCGDFPACSSSSPGWNLAGCDGVPCGAGAELAEACVAGSGVCVPTATHAARQECR